MAADGRSDGLLVAALVAGATHADAAKAAGCSERTVRRRLDDPGFRAELHAARSELLDRTLDLLAGGGEVAARRLRELVDDPGTPLAVVVSASRALLGEQRAYRGDHEFGERLSHLEAAVAARGLRVVRS